MSEKIPVEKEAPAREAGCLERVIALAVVLLISSLAYMVFLVFQPQNLTDLSPVSGDAVAARDLKSVFNQAIEGSYVLTLSEAEINAYFAKTLAARQAGACAGFVKFEKILVRLEKDRAEIIMVRRIGGRSFTLSTWLSLEQTENESGEITTNVNFSGGPMPVVPGVSLGGRFGKLYVPQGFIHLIRPAYEALAAQYAEEIHLGFESMSRIKIEDNALVLDPRFHQGSETFGF